MKKTILICLIPVMIGVVFYLFSLIGDLLSAKNDIQVIVGVSLITIIPIIIIKTIKTLFKNKK